MIDTIVWLWNASPVNPLAVAMILWVVWKLYSAVGTKIFLTLVAVVAGAAIFWNAERVQQILTWLGAAYVALHLFGFVGGGESMFRYVPAPDTDPEPTRRTREEPFIPENAPFGFDPSIQPHGAHRHGYEPELDPHNTNKLC